MVQITHNLNATRVLLARNSRVTRSVTRPNTHSLAGNTEVPWCRVDIRVLIPRLYNSCQVVRQFLAGHQFYDQGNDSLTHQ